MTVERLDVNVPDSNLCAGGPEYLAVVLVTLLKQRRELMERCTYLDGRLDSHLSAEELQDVREKYTRALEELKQTCPRYLALHFCCANAPWQDGLC